jgi:hypothetical protein
LKPGASKDPYGLCLVPDSFRSGVVSVRAKLSDPDSCARIVVGHNTASSSYYSIGIGGYGFAYVIDEYLQGRGWRLVAGAGVASEVQLGTAHDIVVSIDGQRSALTIDGVRVLETTLPAPLFGDQIGLFAWGAKRVQFEAFNIKPRPPTIFVVMQFGEPFDGLYKNVIKPVAKAAGFEVERGDDVFRPGVILEEIVRSIVDADVVVADITPPNANVFYELGYAHALRKPTILLANRTLPKLPFDVSGYRVLFYDDTIAGKVEIEANLSKYLDAIRRNASTS